MKKALFTMAAIALLSSCQSEVEEALVKPSSDLVEVSFGMVGEFTAEDAELTRASHNFEYYVAISADAATDGNITSGYVGRFTSLTDVTVALQKGTTYNFYISAFESVGATADLSTICATQGEFVEVSSATPYAPDFADTKVDRYYGSTSEEIVTNTTVSVNGKRFAYGINVNIETPLEGKVVMSSESPAFTYTVTSNDEAKVENNIFCLAGVDEDGSKETSVTVKWYDASENEIASVSKLLTIARNHMKTLKVKALDPKVNFTFSVDDTALFEEVININDDVVVLPNFNNHEYVDLGVVVKGKNLYCAKVNIGASEAEGFGTYFAWGETSGNKSKYDISTYKFYNTSLGEYTKYHSEADDIKELQTIDDAAHVLWGGDWRIPSAEEICAFKDQCTWTWTTLNGIKGHRVTGSNGNSVFIPAAGFYDGSELKKNGIRGYYWSSSVRIDYMFMAFSLCNDSGSIFANLAESDRSFGFTIRPICSL